MSRAGEPANILAAPALAPDFFQTAPAPNFFPKQLRLLVFFFKRLRLRLRLRLQLQEAKNTWLRLYILFPAN